MDDEVCAVKYDMEREEIPFQDRNCSGPQDPLPRTSPPLSFLPKPNADPNVVTWDSPNDPSNPQNWSISYKWLLTATCTAMTLNVYALPSSRYAPY
jgi:hypothetical protein